MSNIALSAGVRANLLSLQNTASLMQTTQTDLATGNKVNSALDNPLEFFTSQSLNNRANALNGLLDSMSNGIQTIQAANNGITSITSLLQELQSVVSQAQADTSGASTTPGSAAVLSGGNTSDGTNHTLTFNLASGISASINTNTTTSASLTGSGGATATANGSFTISSANVGATPLTVSFSTGNTLTAIAGDITTQGSADGITAAVVNGQIQITNNTGNNISLADATAGSLAQIGFTGGQSSTNGVVGSALTASQLASAINSNSALSGQVSASVVNGSLNLQNLTTSAISLTGMTATAVTGKATDNSQSLGLATGGGMSTVRTNLQNEFNTILSQINSTAGDSGYNGVNLLNAGTLNLQFNENNTSNISITLGSAVNYTNLGITAPTGTDFNNSNNLSSLASDLTTALQTLQTQATSISSSLSVVQARQDFTKNMVNTLQTGASNLVLADPNQEGANLLALQTRQSLSESALSMAAQAQSAVLRLFQ
jgi:flagellin